jgi:hypothetical protein
MGEGRQPWTNMRQNQLPAKHFPRCGSTAEVSEPICRFFNDPTAHYWLMACTSRVAYYASAEIPHSFCCDKRLLASRPRRTIVVQLGIFGLDEQSLRCGQSTLIQCYARSGPVLAQRVRSYLSEIWLQASRQLSTSAAWV